MVCVTNIRGGEIEFLQGVEVSVGERLFPQYVDKATICGKTHEAAKKCVAKQELSTSDIRGAFTFSCALNVMLGEADGMQDVSDKMACALGSAPLFGMIGGPELGHAYGDKTYTNGADRDKIGAPKCAPSPSPKAPRVPCMRGAPLSRCAVCAGFGRRPLSSWGLQLFLVAIFAPSRYCIANR